MRLFGRITERSWCQKAMTEARKLTDMHRVHAMQLVAQANRANLDARHHQELADFYAEKYRALNTPTTGESK